MLVVGFAENTHRRTGIRREEVSVEALDTLTGTVIGVTIFHCILAVHLRNLAHSIQDGVARVARSAGLCRLVEIGTLGIDSQTLALTEVAACSAFQTLPVRIKLGAAIG